MTPADKTRLERTRRFLLTLPRVVETVQWGDNYVYWVMDKAVGGKMFALFVQGAADGPVFSFAAGPQRAPLLLERDGVEPAPYLARAHWVGAGDWQVFERGELERELRLAYDYTLRKMPPRLQRLHDGTDRDYAEHLRFHRQQAAGKARA